jgi:hypothetical protein
VSSKDDRTCEFKSCTATNTRLVQADVVSSGLTELIRMCPEHELRYVISARPLTRE